MILIKKSALYNIHLYIKHDINNTILCIIMEIILAR